VTFTIDSLLRTLFDGPFGYAHDGFKAVQWVRLYRDIDAVAIADDFNAAFFGGTFGEHARERPACSRSQHLGK